MERTPGRQRGRRRGGRGGGGVGPHGGRGAGPQGGQARAFPLPTRGPIPPPAPAPARQRGRTRGGARGTWGRPLLPANRPIRGCTAAPPDAELPATAVPTPTGPIPAPEQHRRRPRGGHRVSLGRPLLPPNRPIRGRQAAPLDVGPIAPAVPAPPGPPVGQGPGQPRAIRGRLWPTPPPTGTAQEAPRAPRAIRGRPLPRPIRGRGPEQ